MALQLVLQKPTIHGNLLHARDVVIGNGQPLHINETVHYNTTSQGGLQKQAFQTVNKMSWSWLRYRQLGISPLTSAASQLFGLTVLVAGVIYLALRLALFLRHDPDFERRQRFKSKIQKMVFFLTPLILLPGYMGAFFWERRFYSQSWLPGSSGAGGAAYQSLGYAGRYTNYTVGGEALAGIATLAKSSYANLTYESTDLRRMAYAAEVTIPTIRAASLDIVAFSVPILVLIFLTGAIVGVFRHLTGRGQEDLDEKTMA